MKKQIVKNLLSNYTARGLGLFLSFLLVPFLISKLGKSAFGVVVLAESLIHFMDVATVSIRNALARHAAFSLSQDRKQDFIEYLSTGRILLFGLAGGVLLTGAYLSFNLSRVLRVPPELSHDSHWMFFWMVLTFVISMPNSAFWAVLYAKQRFDLINFSQSSAMLLRAILIFTAFTFLPAPYVSLASYGFAYLLVSWLDNLIVYLWAKKISPGLSLHWKHFRKEKVRGIFSFGVYTSMNYLSAVIYDNVIQVVINLFWGPAYNAIYGVSAKFPIMMRRLFLEQTWTLTPTFIHLAATKDHERMKRLFFVYSKLMAVLSLPVSVFMIVFAGPVIELWVGPDFKLASRIMPVQMLPLIFIIPAAAGVCLVNAHAKMKLPSLVNVAAAVLKLLAGILLAKFLGWGLMGIVVGAAVVSIPTTVFFGTNYSCRTAGISTTEFWKQTYVRPMGWTLVVVALGFFAVHALPGGFHSPKPALFSVLGVLGILYFLGAYKFVINREEKQYLQQLIEAIRSVRTKKIPKETIPTVDLYEP